MRERLSREALAELIRRNSAEIVRLHRRVHQTWAERALPGGEGRWRSAAVEFRERYNALAYPGGYEHALTLLDADDAPSIEIALVFLEEAPYFFRSGFMSKRLRQKVKQCRWRGALSERQLERLDVILHREQQWRARDRDARSE
ncbi:hypothetical protein [Chitinimonas sp.]|uniref:hypothetical protein n=1 Tax=Chitinimonas sp. TaxID=1934313 RepID=UPI0035AEF5A6